jgi:hypothetical protein
MKHMEDADGETFLFIGGHYEVKNPGSGQEVTKYYFAGASRIAMRKYIIPQSMSVEYLVSTGSGQAGRVVVYHYTTSLGISPQATSGTWI